MRYKRTRILICVESELLYLGLSSLIAQIPEFEVIGFARSEEESIQYISSITPDMVIVDLAFTKIGAIKLIGSIKKRSAQTRVLVLSHDTDADSFYSALKAGVDGFCRKESLSSNMILAMESVSSGGFWLDSGSTAYFKAGLASFGQVLQRKPEKQNQDLLSSREREVLDFVKDGLSNTEIAKNLRLSPETIKTHIKHIFEKLDVKHRTEAVVEAMKRGLISAA